MVAQRANNKKHQDLKGQNRLTTKNSNHLSDENELIKHLDIDLAKTSSSEINNEDDHYAHQKAMLALPHRVCNFSFYLLLSCFQAIRLL